MKNIICLIGEAIIKNRKHEIVSALSSYSENLGMHFNFELFDSELPLDYEKYSLAVTCFPPKDVIKKFPALEFVISLNAGVDNLVHEVSDNMVLTRVIHQPAIDRMSQYALYCILDYCLLMDKYRINQRTSLWARTPPLFMKNNQVGILGMGTVGRTLSNLLNVIEKPVLGYSRTKKDFLEHSFCENQLEEFLSKTNILINALPLNNSTQGIINKTSLSCLPDDSCFINIGRGGHIIEQDLLDALDSGKLNKAYLDVFSIEPLPKNHPFWTHEKIFMTPHISGAFDINDILPATVQQIIAYDQKGIIINAVEHGNLQII